MQLKYELFPYIKKNSNDSNKNDNIKNNNEDTNEDDNVNCNK